MSGGKIVEGLRDALSYAKGDVNSARTRRICIPDHVDVRSIRERLNMSQRQFALQFGIPLTTVRNWEQGRRKPEAMARALLQIIETDPTVVERAFAIG